MLKCLLIVCVCIAQLNGFPTNAPLSDLFYLRKHFYLADIDDDGVIEYADLYSTLKRTDTNQDGFMTSEEIAKDAEASTIKEFVEAQDYDKNGKLSRVDLDALLFLHRKPLGNDLHLGEYLQVLTSLKNYTEMDDVISINTFVNAESNFMFMDVDDDNLVSEDEYRSEYTVADFNSDGVLSDLELKGFVPLQFVPITSICSDDCSKEYLLSYFKEADQNSDGKLDLEEYVKKFRELVNNNGMLNMNE